MEENANEVLSTESVEVPAEAPAEVVASDVTPETAPEGEVVLGASQDGGVVTEPTPVIQ